MLAQLGHGQLITDCAQTSESQFGKLFAHNVLIPADSASNRCEEIEHTHAGQFFSRAVEEIRSMPEQRFVWIHHRGLTGTWDAPLWMREQLVDESEPSPPDFVEPPVADFRGGDCDPDQLWGLECAHAAQVGLIDTMLDFVFGDLGLLDDDCELAWAITSTRAYPLGQHGIVGHEPATAYGEMTQVPLLARAPGDERAPVRDWNLYYPAAIADWICAWLQLPVESSQRGSNVLLTTSGDATAVRTRRWLMIESQGDRRELFAKPDDVWEANEIADLCPHETTAMNELKSHVLELLQSGCSTDEITVPDLLRESH